MLTVGQYYRVTWQVLIILAAALAVGASVVRAAILVPFFLIAYAQVTPVSGVMSQNKKRISWGIIAALSLLSIHQIMRFARFGDLIEILIEMISGTLPLLLLNHERVRSYWLAVLNVTIVAISSITFAASVPIYIGFIAFVGVLLLNLNAASLFQATLSEPGATPSLPRGYFQQFAYVLPAGALSAALIFFAFPRVETFGLALGGLGGKSRTGYAGLVSLDGNGEIESSQDLAFMVDSVDKAWLRKSAPKLLYRGDALDTFDGARWSNNIFSYRAGARSQDLRVAVKHLPDPRILQIRMEATAANAVFYPAILVNVLDQSPSAGPFLFNANGSVIRTQFSMDRFTYSLKIVEPLPLASVPDYPVSSLKARIVETSEREVFPYEMTRKDLESYLLVPPAVAEARWFTDWAAEVGVDPAADGVLAVAKKIERHFQAAFKATMKNTFSQANALAAFLSTDRQGHCEYFATATALFLRSRGVPSRVVVGYRGGRFNELIDVVEVSEESAHAWVEAYVPDFGWVTLDPTPDGGAVAGGRSGWRQYVNAASFWFREYVVDYDYGTQREILKSFRALAKTPDDRGVDWRGLLAMLGKPLAAAAILIVVALAAYIGLRRQSGGRNLPRYYRLFAARMAGRDLRRRKGETLREFHTRCVAGGVDGEIMTLVDQAIEADFYGAAPLSEGERQALARRLATLKSSSERSSRVGGRRTS